jgi:hypothetical protein
MMAGMSGQGQISQLLKESVTNMIYFYPGGLRCISSLWIQIMILKQISGEFFTETEKRLLIGSNQRSIVWEIHFFQQFIITRIVANIFRTVVKIDVI